MIKRFATITAGLVIAFATVGSPAQATVTHHRAPNAQERQELRDARHGSGSGYTCHLEWDGPVYPGYEAICAKKPATDVASFNDGWRTAKADDVDVYAAAIKTCVASSVARRDLGACVARVVRHTR